MEEPDISEVRKAIAARELVVFETTLLTRRPPVSFDHAVADGRAHLREEAEAAFERVIDITRARSAGIRPLGRTAITETGAATPVDGEAAPPLPPPPDFGDLPG